MASHDASPGSEMTPALGARCHVSVSCGDGHRSHTFEISSTTNASSKHRKAIGASALPMLPKLPMCHAVADSSHQMAASLPLLGR